MAGRSVTLPQRRFIAEYLIDRDAPRAAAVSGLQVSAEARPNGFYVYGLIDPVTNHLFYVGKGTRDRWRSHLREAAGSGNQRKRARVFAAAAAGRQVLCLIVAESLSETDAYVVEAALIDSIPGLTNLSSGQRTADQRSKDEATELLSRVIPFETWMARAARTVDDVRWYRRIVAELERIAEHGQNTVMVVRQRVSV